MMRLRKSRALAAAAVSAGALVSAAIAQVAIPESVETAPLARDAFSTGTLDSAEGALSPELWAGADPQTLEYLLTKLPSRPSAPSLGIAMRRTLLSPGNAPQGAAPSLGGKKLLALARAGFVEEARTVASLSSIGRADAWTGQAHAVADLLSGDIAAACRRNANLSEGRDELFWVKLRVFCYAEAGERDAADLTLNVLREQGALSETEMDFLTAAATGAAPKAPPPAKTALEYAIAKKMNLPLAPGLIAEADGGVLVSIARDTTLEAATRISAAERAAAMGVFSTADLVGVFQSVDFETAELGDAAGAAATRASDPVTDALLYQSVKAMTAPEFIRDKAKRIALALSLGDSFYRAYALSVLYAEEIETLEGVIVAPEEAGYFAMAEMAVGDSVGAGQWLSAMVGANASVSALPEALGMKFIDQVNLLALLDQQTAASIARAGGVSILGESASVAPPMRNHGDPSILAEIIEAAFDAAVEDKPGQASLAALAASNTSHGGEIETVIVGQSLRVAGLGDLARRYQFEKAWSATFGDEEPVAEGAPDAEDDGGLKPRLKPHGSQ